MVFYNIIEILNSASLRTYIFLNVLVTRANIFPLLFNLVFSKLLKNERYPVESSIFFLNQILLNKGIKLLVSITLNKIVCSV